MRKLKITRVVASVSYTPLNQDYYPDMTDDQAVAFEMDPEEDAWKEYFFESGDIDIETKVEVINEKDN